MKKGNQNLDKLKELVKMAISNMYEKSLPGDRRVKCFAYPEESFFDYLVESFPKEWYTDVYRVFLDDEGFIWHYESDPLLTDSFLETLESFLEHAEDCLPCQEKFLDALESHLRWCRRRVRQAPDPELLDALFKRANKKLHTHFKDEGHPCALAAAEAVETRIGISYGVAIDPVTGKGTLIRCSARVSANEVEKGSLSINVIERIGYKIGEVETTITSPFGTLARQLNELFLYDPVLRSFGVTKRTVIVDVEQVEHEGYFEEAGSLALPIIISILLAVRNREEDKRRCYSGKVLKTCALARVGKVRQKLEIVRRYTKIREVILPKENIKDFDPDEVSGASDISLLFFSNVSEVLNYLDLFPEPSTIDTAFSSRAPEPRGIWLASDESGACDAIVSLGKEKGINEAVIRDVIEVAEDLCQMRRENHMTSTALIVGNAQSIKKVLPYSHLNLSVARPIGELKDYLYELSGLVNGTTMGFVVDEFGKLDSIRKFVRIEGDYDVSRVLDSERRKYAILSSITNSIIFLLGREGNTISVFCNDAMIAKYCNGDWCTTDFHAFESFLIRLCKDKNYHVDTVIKVARCCVKMSSSDPGAFFAFFGDVDEIEDKYKDRLSRLGIKFDKDRVGDLLDDELINIAREGGAVLIDRYGNLHTFMAHLKIEMTEPFEFEHGSGERRMAAQKFTKVLSSFAFVVSKDGLITVYSDGKKQLVI